MSDEAPATLRSGHGCQVPCRLLALADALAAAVEPFVWDIRQQTEHRDESPYGRDKRLLVAYDNFRAMRDEKENEPHV